VDSQSLRAGGGLCHKSTFGASSFLSFFPTFIRLTEGCVVSHKFLEISRMHRTVLSLWTHSHTVAVSPAKAFNRVPPYKVKTITSEDLPPHSFRYTCFKSFKKKSRMQVHSGIIAESQGAPSEYVVLHTYCTREKDAHRQLYHTCKGRKQKNGSRVYRTTLCTLRNKTHEQTPRKKKRAKAGLQNAKLYVQWVAAGKGGGGGGARSKVHSLDLRFNSREAGDRGCAIPLVVLLEFEALLLGSVRALVSELQVQRVEFPGLVGFLDCLARPH